MYICSIETVQITLAYSQPQRSWRAESALAEGNQVYLQETRAVGFSILHSLDQTLLPHSRQLHPFQTVGSLL